VPPFEENVRIETLAQKSDLGAHLRFDLSAFGLLPHHLGEPHPEVVEKLRVERMSGAAEGVLQVADVGQQDVRRLGVLDVEIRVDLEVGYEVSVVFEIAPQAAQLRGLAAAAVTGQDLHQGACRAQDALAALGNGAALVTAARRQIDVTRVPGVERARRIAGIEGVGQVGCRKMAHGTSKAWGPGSLRASNLAQGYVPGRCRTKGSLICSICRPGTPVQKRFPPYRLGRVGLDPNMKRNRPTLCAHRQNDRIGITQTSVAGVVLDDESRSPARLLGTATLLEIDVQVDGERAIARPTQPPRCRTPGAAIQRPSRRRGSAPGPPGRRAGFPPDRGFAVGRC